MTRGFGLLACSLLLVAVLAGCGGGERKPATEAKEGPAQSGSGEPGVKVSPIVPEAKGVTIPLAPPPRPGTVKGN
jgi:hypothetical protein